MDKLYIPYGIGIEKEYILGFGKKEVKHFFIGLLLTGVISAAAFLITQQIVVIVMCLMIGTAGSFLTTRKETYSQSVVEVVQNIIRFRRTQQRFSYRYKS